MAETEAAAPERIVTAAISPIRGLPLHEAPSVLPGLKPNQPKARMKQPIAAMFRLGPGIGLGVPSLLYWPKRGPSTTAAARPAQPPCECTTPEPAKSRYPL